VLGPGLLEFTYEPCLPFELANRGLNMEQHKPLYVVYQVLKQDCGYRLDLLQGGAAIVEVKALNALGPIHKAQILSYLRLSR
jgi:GxxExxY protein